MIVTVHIITLEQTGKIVDKWPHTAKEISVKLRERSLVTGYNTRL